MNIIESLFLRNWKVTLIKYLIHNNDRSPPVWYEAFWSTNVSIPLSDKCGIIQILFPNPREPVCKPGLQLPASAAQAVWNTDWLEKKEMPPAFALS